MSPGRTGGLRAHRVDGVCGPFAAPSDGATQVAANRRMIDMRRVTAPARTHPMNPFRKAAKPESSGLRTIVVPLFTSALTRAGTAGRRTHTPKTAAGVGARTDAVEPDRSA
ncbi:hypothetical protein M218_21730 [Burkholderia pseudomallei MSHR338]|nr:hypothetical protein M218_21730 [Burkholderia pseudomallei MSHR338]